MTSPSGRTGLVSEKLTKRQRRGRLFAFQLREKVWYPESEGPGPHNAYDRVRLRSGSRARFSHWLEAGSSPTATNERTERVRLTVVERSRTRLCGPGLSACLHFRVYRRGNALTHGESLTRKKNSMN